MPGDGKRNRTQSLESSLKEFKRIQAMDVKATAAYVSKLGFPLVAENFAAHQIDGSLFAEIGKQELIQMGVLCVGDRLKFITEIKKIQRMARAAQRKKLVWKGEEFRPGPCGDMLPFGFPGCCCIGPPEQYTLLKARFSKRFTDYTVPFCGACCGYTEAKNNTDLSIIQDVDTKEVKPSVCDCCNPARGHVQVTVKDQPAILLFLKKDKANEFARALQDAIQAAKMLAQTRIFMK